MIKAKTNLTPADFNNLKKVFATKNDLKNFKKVFATKNDIIQFKDDILHEVIAMREELTMVQGHKDQLEDHEDRHEVVETKLQITPA